MRINKFVAQCGISSRRKAEEYILQGMVKVNDKVVRELATDINPEVDIVKVGDIVIKPTQDYVYYMLNKPKGYVCSSDDEFDRKTVLDLMRGVDKRVYPVGRLDYDSEGMLILTNDGDLTYNLTHPSKKIEKTYIAKIEGPILESELAVLRAGVVVDGVRYSECKAKLIDYSKNVSKIEVTIHEGKNRQIRKSFEAIGKNVIFLKRVSIGSLRLGGLTRGTFRELNPEEVSLLLVNKE